MSEFQPNTEGIFFDLPEDVYRKAPGVAQSALKHMERSPAHYRAYLDTPDNDTPDKLFGRILHASLLEPKRPDCFVIRPEGKEGDFKTKEGKAWRDSQKLPIITKDDASRICGAKASILAHPYAAAIIERSRKEVSVFKIDPETGLMRKGRLDLLFTDDSQKTVVADVKKCQDASAEGFMKSVAKFGYYRQNAYYTDLAEASGFLFIAVEDESPFGVNVFELDAEAIRIGRETYRRELALVAECERSSEWPAYPAQIQTIGLPAWLARKAA